MHILTNTHTHTHTQTHFYRSFLLYILEKLYEIMRKLVGKSANMSDENIDVFVLSGNTAKYVEIVLVLVSRPNCE